MSTALTELAATFGVLGATAWGGVYAQVPRLQALLVEKKRWLTEPDLHEIVAVASLVPGPTFLALAAMVGYRVRGWRGGAVAILSLVTPSYLLVLLVLSWLPTGLQSQAMGGVTRAVSVAVVGILGGSALRLCLRGADPVRGGVLGLVLFVSLLAGLHPAIGALAGIIAGSWWVRPGRGEAP